MEKEEFGKLFSVPTCTRCNKLVSKFTLRKSQNGILFTAKCCGLTSIYNLDKTILYNQKGFFFTPIGSEKEPNENLPSAQKILLPTSEAKE
jgi:hypothetical protein